MVRILKEWDPDPDAARALIIWHQGDPYPGTDRLHLIQIVETYLVPGIQHALVYVATAALADIAAAYCLACPEVIQDFCTQCHPARGVNKWPRLNIMRGQPWPVITPALLQDWL
jgi:hypothetical protein